MQSIVKIIESYQPDEGFSLGILPIFEQKKEEINNLLLEINRAFNYSYIEKVIPLIKQLTNALIAIYDIDTTENSATKSWFDDTIKLTQSIIDKHAFLSDSNTREAFNEHVNSTLEWIRFDIEESSLNQSTQKHSKQIATHVEKAISNGCGEITLEIAELGEELFNAFTNGEITDPALKELVSGLVSSSLQTTSRADILVQTGLRLPLALRNLTIDHIGEVPDVIPDNIVWCTFPSLFAPVFRKIRETEMFGVSETWLENFVLRSNLKESNIKKVVKEADVVLRAANPWLDERQSRHSFEHVKKGSERAFLQSLERVVLVAKYLHAAKAQLSFSDIGMRTISISMHGVSL